MESERQSFGAGQIVHGPGYILKTAPAQEFKKKLAQPRLRWI